MVLGKDEYLYYQRLLAKETRVVERPFEEIEENKPKKEWIVQNYHEYEIGEKALKEIVILQKDSGLSKEKFILDYLLPATIQKADFSQ